MRFKSDFTLHADACYSIPCDSSAIPFCMAHELHKHDKGNPRKRSFQSVGSTSIIFATGSSDTENIDSSPANTLN
ncbi:hypothetical protein [Pseudomonas phage pPA-3099-2aT.2]|uniref:Uncharacterized protein n=1 Tax=Pseudomonas phage pPA-3099-2aT.2 TaxID=3003808 RepID=A0AAE9W502_9CAUD|nr:hypothetical protein QE325_gp142 [Pseudomonas phage pPA-3099-2aT.2]WBQ35239.1 hypothetical protein [Pseudomonas phage pPA-3099-2aT.2]